MPDAERIEARRRNARRRFVLRQELSYDARGLS